MRLIALVLAYFQFVGHARRPNVPQTASHIHNLDHGRRTTAKHPDPDAAANSVQVVLGNGSRGSFVSAASTGSQVLSARVRTVQHHRTSPQKRTALTLLEKQVRVFSDVQSFEPLMWQLECGLLGALVMLLILIAMMLLLPGASGLVTLIFRQSDTDDQKQANTNAMQVMAEHNLCKSEAKKQTELEVIDLGSSIAGFWYYLPLTISFLSIAVPIGFTYCGYGYTGMFFPVAFVVYVSWKLGLHIAICASVGIVKMRIYEKADFHAIYMQTQEHAAEQLSAGPSWDDIVHFVIVVNYKEDLEVLRSAISSVAASPIAKVQIGLVLAMEDREEGAADKAAKLKEQFVDKFKHMFVTFHPSDIAGEVPGKPSNTNWAAKMVLDQFMPEQGYDMKRVVFTVMDADSEFHHQYFSALTWSFVQAGGGEEETPDRYLTIWQPPILHYKNYLRQPALVRLASWMQSEHELANLADPYCTKLPYSTYSISAELVKKVDGWDPDWISEDQHMALKCFLATGGHLQVQPIFLAVMNYAPECDSLTETLNARWVQAKRHALGFGEVVYTFGKLCFTISQISGIYPRLVFTWRSFWLLLKLLTVHLFFATSFLIGPLTGSCVFYFHRHLIAPGLVPVYCMFQMVHTISLNWGIVVSVLTYEKMKDRVEGSDTASIFFRSKTVHCFLGIIQYNVLLPMVWCFGAAAEWIASVKLTQTHLFDHEVAAKPTSLADKSDKDSTDDA